MDKVECTVCGAEVGRMGIGSHAGMHKREFRERFGYVPADYQEVRDALGGVDQSTTLEDFTDAD